MIEIYADGSCVNIQDEKNRTSGVGVVIIDSETGETVEKLSEYAGKGEDVTNHTAEYSAVLAGLDWREENQPDEPCIVRSDSDLIVNQVQQNWECNADHLEPYLDDVLYRFDEQDEIERSTGSYIRTAHRLAQAGAKQTDPDNIRTRKKSSSSSSSTEKTYIEPDVLDEIPTDVGSPHGGIVPDAIPDELKRRVQWVNWKPGTRNGDETKLPIEPGTTWEPASATDQSTWTDFETAVNSVNDEVIGIGFVLTTGDPYIVLDLDDCRDRETGEIEEWAHWVIENLCSYAQISVSWSGVHVFLKTHDSIPDSWTNIKDGEEEIEMYEWGRFITMTGRHIDWTPNRVRLHGDFPAWVERLQEQL